MKIASICDSMVTGARHLRALEDLSETELFLIVCSAKPASLGYRVARDVAKLFLNRQRSKNLMFLLRMWTKKRVCILSSALDSAKSTELLQNLACDVALHGAGVIYREATINCFRLGILNAHIGRLPRYRGRSGMEWSLL